MERNLSNSNTADAVKTTPDIIFKGNPDQWKLISKASSKMQGWMKSTKAMCCVSGVLVQVTTEHRDPENGKVICCAEALEFIPGGKIVEDGDGYQIF